MKLGRVVKRMQALLDAGKRHRRRQAGELKVLLGRLRRKHRKLKRELAEAPDPDTANTLKGKLKVVRAQRRKGVDALRALRKR